MKIYQTYKVKTRKNPNTAREYLAKYLGIDVERVIFDGAPHQDPDAKEVVCNFDVEMDVRGETPLNNVDLSEANEDIS